MLNKKAIAIASFTLVMVLTHATVSHACGWWGDGEVSLSSSDTDFFVPYLGGEPRDPSNMARLSTAYRTGDGVEQNNELALTWARRAAAAGHAGAMNDLGYMYEIGFAGEMNEAAAVFWYQKAADQEFAAAQHSLATMLRSGRGIEADIPAANIWLRRAAQNSHPSAAAELATIIWRQETSSAFPEEACFWWLIAIRLKLDVSPERCFSESPELTETEFSRLKDLVNNW